MFKKVLIANRGEIARRIIRTCQKLSLQTVVVYTPEDKSAPYVLEGDVSYPINSYLDPVEIVKLTTASGAEAIHPGYGFLAESPALAKACEEAGIVFIGPNTETLALMGDKNQAKSAAQKVGLPTISSYSPEDKLPFPVLIKPVAGGGGKGMHVANSKAELSTLIERAKREALGAFGDERLLFEDYIPDPRHVEIQVFGDTQGNVVHLFERDCSLQRRHQKIIEEALAPNLDKKTKEKLYEAAVKLCKSVSYVGAGTVEFLLDNKGHFYFLEMNPRLQVEHPVTEAITGLDLVEWQLLVAAGSPLPCKQSQIKATGHAIEARLYAEDPEKNFLPSVGQIYHYDPPAESKSLRIDSGIRQSQRISASYDPMLAKIIAFGKTREAARLELIQGVSQFHVAGVKTNGAFLMEILESIRFVKGAYTTSTLDTLKPSTYPKVDLLTLAMGVCVLNGQKVKSPWNRRDHWLLNDPGQAKIILSQGRETYECSLERRETEYSLKWHKESLSFSYKATNGQYVLTSSGKEVMFEGVIVENHLVLFRDGHVFDFTIGAPQESREILEESQGHLMAPMPGKVIALHVKKGDSVKQGEPLVAMEAMKMEHGIHAPFDGTIIAIPCELGEIVEEGRELVQMEPKAK